jgi:two-component system, OmpR family, alkaline phosphatase synthesis response regulator PhoP
MPIPILIIDDEPFVRMLLEQTLEDLGNDVVIVQAKDGEEGLRLAKDIKPRLIFLDIMMPRLSGLEVCRLLREDTILQHTPIVLLTARGEESDRVKGESLGIRAYIMKPFDPDDVLRLAQQLLTEEKTSDAT